jgi:choline-sulfatase
VIAENGPVRIVYLDLDSQRPDHLGAYGYHRGTSPNLDRLATDGVRFEHAYCQASPCVPSRAAFFSGRFDVHNGVATHWGPGSNMRGSEPLSPRDPAPPPMLAAHLRAHGYQTVSFTPFAERHQAGWFTAGWSELHAHTLKRGNERADEVNEALLPWLRIHGAEENYFLHVNYWDPHRNYRMPLEWLDRFADSPPPAWPDQAAIDAHQANPGPFTASELYPFGDGRPPVPAMPERIETREDFTRWIDGYDASIAFMDHHIGQLVEVLAELGVLDETVFIISADHGEAQGEHGVYGDHCDAGEAVQRIPLIVRWPGVTRGEAACTDLVYNLDLAPTLCDLLGLHIPPGWDGRSFAARLRGLAGEPRSHLVWSHGLYTCQRVVRTPRWALMRTYHPGLFPFDPLALYDMELDPHQTTDVATEHPDVVAELDHLLTEWLQEQLGRHGRAVDPLQQVVETGPFKYVELQPWLDRLDRRGRHADANAIRRRLSG